MNCSHNFRIISRTVSLPLLKFLFFSLILSLMPFKKYSVLSSENSSVDSSSDELFIDFCSDAPDCSSENPFKALIIKL